MDVHKFSHFCSAHRTSYCLHEPTDRANTQERHRTFSFQLMQLNIQLCNSVTSSCAVIKFYFCYLVVLLFPFRSGLGLLTDWPCVEPLNMTKVQIKNQDTGVMIW